MAVERMDNRSLGDLFAELSRETGTLLRQEVELAKTELTASLRKTGTGAGVTAAGGALVHAGLLVILAAIVLGLSQTGLPAWLAALLVGGITMLAGFVLAQRGFSSLRRTSITPTQTIETLKENATWTTRQGA